MDNPVSSGTDEMVERVARHIQLWWMTQKHEPLHQNDAADLARAALSAINSRNGERSLVEQLRYHQAAVNRLSQQIAGDPMKGVIMKLGEDGYLHAALSSPVSEKGEPE